MKNDHRDVVIVGGGLGGLRTAEGLRVRGFSGSIAVVGAESHLPYDRPPLTKAVLRGELDSTTLRDEFEPLGVDLHLGVRAAGLDPNAKRVTLSSGSSLSYGVAVLAPGGRPRRLGADAAVRGAHVVRTIDDALGLRAALDERPDLTVVGAGFIGCEVAASARRRGASVTLVDVLPAPMIRVLGAAGAEFVAQLHHANDVALYTGAAVTSAAADGTSVEVVLDNDVKLTTGNVVFGLGVEPDINWLTGSGITLADGIQCTARGQTSVPDVYAVGDAASWWHPLAEGYRRLEHWTSTVDQARVVAGNIAGGDQAAMTLQDPPYFWSDQYEVRIQALGFVDPADDVTVLNVDGRTVILYTRDGRLRAVVGFNAARVVAQLRPLVVAAAPLEQVRERVGPTS